MPNTRIEALIKLLSDDDSATVRVVSEALISTGEQAIEPLRHAAESDEAHLRVRARNLLLNVLLRQAEDELASMAAGAEPDLERALVLLARTEHPTLDHAHIAAELDDLACAVRAALEGADSPADIVQRFVQALFVSERFRGNTAGYYDTRNSMINEVLEHRTGIPISLAAVAMLVGRRCGLQMQGVGMPRHFLVRITTGGQSFTVDAFGGGQVLSREACRAMLAGLDLQFRDEFLAPVSDRRMLRRVFENLLATHAREGDAVRTERLRRLVLAVQSESP